jgi:hypothetical protein
MSTLTYIQSLWEDYFDYDEYLPSEVACMSLYSYAEFDVTIIEKAFDICSKSSKMRSKTFDERLSYVYGIIRNLKQQQDRDKVKREGR